MTDVAGAETALCGPLSKMKTSADADARVQYRLPLGDAEHPLNGYLGRHVRLHWQGRIFCVHCGRKTNKSFDQGYCYPCFTRLAQCDTCIVKPERCHFAKGTCREPAWGQEFCFRPHVVYLANSTGIKVGITRESQIPVRWMDQGAIQALPLFSVRSRRAAGLVEVALASRIPDKTQWRALLKGPAPLLDMQAERERVQALCKDLLESLQLPEEDGMAEACNDAVEWRAEYPVLQYPVKIESLDFGKQPVVEGVLTGIKGQYLLLDTGVINIRKFGGYEVAASFRS